MAQTTPVSPRRACSPACLSACSLPRRTRARPRPHRRRRRTPPTSAPPFPLTSHEPRTIPPIFPTTLSFSFPFSPSLLSLYLSHFTSILLPSSTFQSWLNSSLALEPHLSSRRGQLAPSAVDLPPSLSCQPSSSTRAHLSPPRPRFLFPHLAPLYHAPFNQPLEPSLCHSASATTGLKDLTISPSQHCASILSG